ncbi:MAG: class I SAM-dependent methyltransferase, partial [Planctomycetaceae bacterium]
MTPRRLSVFFGFPSYAGNSGTSSEVSDLREWFAPLLVKLKTDPYFTERIESIWAKTLTDTPCPMVRNRFVRLARQHGADVLVMVDSDHGLLHHAGEPWYKPFFESSFRFLYDHYDKGPVVIGAPYVGHPPHGNCFVFRWKSGMDFGRETGFSLEQYGREEAAMLSDIQECAALPTGLIMYDMRSFDLLEPPYFRYEYADNYEDEKASTEDVQNTRDISMCGVEKLGYNPVFCNWDSWIAHYKPLACGKPTLLRVEDVTGNLRAAVERGLHRGESVVDLGDAETRLADLGLRSRPVQRVPEAPDTEPSKNGKPESFHHTTPPEHLEALRELVRGERHRRVRDSDDVISVIEIGSWVGESAIAMADTGMCHVYCVDHFLGNTTDYTSRIVADATTSGERSVRRRFFDNVGERFGESVFLVEVESLATAKEPLELGIPVPADIIFIDADHSYESTKADILAWLPHVKPGGVMLGHDYRTQQFPGVTQAVDEIFGDVAKPYGMTEQGGFWLVRMREEHALPRLKAVTDPPADSEDCTHTVS